MIDKAQFGQISDDDPISQVSDPPNLLVWCGKDKRTVIPPSPMELSLIRLTVSATAAIVLWHAC